MLKISLIQKIIDASLVAGTWMLSYYIRFQMMHGAQSGLAPTFIKIIPFVVIITLYSMHRADLYKSMRFSSRFKELYSVIRANTGAVIFLVIMLYFSGQERISRATILMLSLIHI